MMAGTRLSDIITRNTDTTSSAGQLFLLATPSRHRKTHVPAHR